MSDRGIPEADWKILRQLHPILLDRFCRRVLDEIQGAAADPSRTPHQAYLAVFDLIRRRDEELANAVADMRRSMAVIRICQMRSLGLMTEEEFGRFSEETRTIVQQFIRLARR